MYEVVCCKSSGTIDARTAQALTSRGIIHNCTQHAHIHAEGIQQRRLQEKLQSHSTVGACLEGSVAKLSAEVKDGVQPLLCWSTARFDPFLSPTVPESSLAGFSIPAEVSVANSKGFTGDKLYQEATAWLKEESGARKELLASAKHLTVRLQHMETSLTSAEQNLSHVNKAREVLECKLSETEQNQVARSATHAAEVEKFELKVQEALAAKDELYKDLVSMQQVQGELKEDLVRSLLIYLASALWMSQGCFEHWGVQGRERVSAEGLKNDLVSVRAEHSKAQDELQQMTNNYTQLTSAHEEMCGRVKTLEESCSALQAEKAELQSLQVELESESSKAKQEMEDKMLAISNELEQSKVACEALQADLAEVVVCDSVCCRASSCPAGSHWLQCMQARDKHMKVVKDKDTAAANHETEASKLQSAASEQQAEIAKLTALLDDGAKELAAARSSIEVIADDSEQQSVKR